MWPRIVFIDQDITDQAVQTISTSFYHLPLLQEFEIQQSVFHVLLDEREGKNATSAMFPLGNIEEYVTSALPSGEWLEELNEHATAAGQPSLSRATRVVLSDVGLIVALGALWLKHSRAELLEALSWLVAQIIGPIADIRLLRFRWVEA